MITYEIGLNETDVDSVHETELLCFPEDPWPKAAFSDDATNSLVTYVLAKDDGKVVGFAGIYTIFEAADIVNVAVRPNYRRQGIATELMTKLLQVAKAKHVELISLEVRQSNHSAQNLYRKFGFRQIAVREKYYQNTEDALIYQIHLSEAQPF